MFDHYYLSEATEHFVKERIANAEKQRATHQAHLQRRARARLRRAVALSLRDGLGRSELAHELSTALYKKSNT